MDFLVLREQLIRQISAGVGPSEMHEQILAAVIHAFNRAGQTIMPEVADQFEAWTPTGTVLPVSGMTANVYATASIYWGVLAGERVHAVSLDRVSAERRSRQIGPVLDVLGVRHALLLSKEQAARQAAYALEVVFGDCRDFMRDYLLDHFVDRAADIIQGPRDRSVIDDIDAILLDEANTLVGFTYTEDFQPVTTGRITARDYFTSYRYLSGTSVAAELAGEELSDVYGLTVVRPSAGSEAPQPEDPDLCFETSSARWAAAAHDVQRRHSAGQPVVLKTTRAELPTVVNSLTVLKLAHSILDERDSAGSLMAVAGQVGAITVVVDDVGRGHPVVLDDMARKAGGLAVISLGRGPSGRVDTWLRSLVSDDAGNEQGECQFLLSADDFLGSGIRHGRWTVLRPWSRRTALADDRIRMAVSEAERAFEIRERGGRRECYEMDSIESQQRAEVWEERERVLQENGVITIVMLAIEATVTRIIASKQNPEELLGELRKFYPCRVDVNALTAASDRSELLLADVRQIYREREHALGNAAFSRLRQQILLRVIDIQWSSHLRHLETARSDALISTNHPQAVEKYREAAGALYARMRQRTQRDVTGYVFQVAAP